MYETIHMGVQKCGKRRQILKFTVITQKTDDIRVNMNLIGSQLSVLKYKLEEAFGAKK